MIGLQELVLKNNIKVKDLAIELGVNPTTIWKWFNDNKVSKKYLKQLSEKFEVEEDYLVKQVNDIHTHTPKQKGFNEYKTLGDTTIVYVYYKKKERLECLIDTEDLEKLINFNRHWSACWFKNVKDYYVVCMDYDDEYKTKSKSKQIFMHRFVVNAPEEYFVDHKTHNGLDNRKDNLRVTENKKNLRNRKGANCNSRTGVRNVFWVDKEQCYYVSIMKNGIHHRWKFAKDEFEKAQAFAKKKREELFGEYAGAS